MSDRERPLPPAGKPPVPSAGKPPAVPAAKPTAPKPSAPKPASPPAEGSEWDNLLFEDEPPTATRPARMFSEQLPPPPNERRTAPPPPRAPGQSPLMGGDDDDDDRTAVSIISPELLAGAARLTSDHGSGSGLGQMFRRERSSQGGPAAPPASPNAPEDWLLDVLFDESNLEDPKKGRPITTETSVVTSARDVATRSVASVPETERLRASFRQQAEESLPDGSMFDPFSEEPDTSTYNAPSRANPSPPAAPKEAATPQEVAKPKELGPSKSPVPPKEPASAKDAAAKEIETLKTPMIPPRLDSGAPKAPAGGAEAQAFDDDDDVTSVASPAAAMAKAGRPSVPADGAAEESAARDARADGESSGEQGELTEQDADVAEQEARLAEDEHADAVDPREEPDGYPDDAYEEEDLGEADPGAEPSAYLAESGQLEPWLARAAFLESEARATDDRATRARGLLVASELFAIAGDEAHAASLAFEARELAPQHPLIHRAARAYSMTEGDFAAVASALDAEIKSAPTADARVHGALLSAQIARTAFHDRDLAVKRLDQAMRASPTDLRAYLDKSLLSLAAGDSVPKLRWPEGSDAEILEGALTAVVSQRTATHETSGEPLSMLEALRRARSAFAARDRSAALGAVEYLVGVPALERAAAWLAAAIAAPDSDLRRRAVELLTDHVGIAGGTAEHGEEPAEGAALEARAAARAIVERAVELADGALSTSTVAAAPANTFSPLELALLAVIAKEPAEAIGDRLGVLAERGELGPLVTGLAAATRSTVGGSGAPRLGSTTERTAIALARALAANPREVQKAVQDIDDIDPTSPVARILSAELSLEQGHVAALATAFGGLGGGESPGEDRERDFALAAGLLFELGARTDDAKQAYERAMAADPASEAAVRAAAALGALPYISRTLAELGERLEDPEARAMLFLEAAIRLGESAESAPRYDELLAKAAEHPPAVTFAAHLGERAARARGDSDALIAWLRSRRQASSDPIEGALDCVREALLAAERDPASATTSLENATRARPSDGALRDLYERLAVEPPADAAPWRAEHAANAADPAERARLLLEAAMMYERTGQNEVAGLLADQAAGTGLSAVARIAAERLLAGGPDVSSYTQRLMEQAKAAQDRTERRELYERLADFDEQVRGDSASALLWHRTILEDNPRHLPSLRRLESLLVGEGREDELELLFAEIGRALDGRDAGETVAHAMVAARLRARSGPWERTRDLVELASAQNAPNLWVLRELAAHAMVADDHAKLRRVLEDLASKTSRPLEIATLLVRAAEAALSAGDTEGAAAHLERAIELAPEHLVANASAADVAGRLGDSTKGAVALDRTAALTSPSARKLHLYHLAACRWQDDVQDMARARAALEAAAAIDVAYADVFARLQKIYIAADDRKALAALLETRLARVTDPQERIDLEIVRGRTLAEIGDATAAKKAFSAVLESSPDHPDALSAFADLCTRERDFEGAEQAIIRLVRLVRDPAEQAVLYMRLGDIYELHLPNPERAELAYREVLKRSTDDETALEKLVGIYRRTKDAPRAIETAQTLVSIAKDAAAKKRRTIELAQVYEELANDTRRAQTLLETSRKELPLDIDLLDALVSFHRRNGAAPAAQFVLDRAAGDARRALVTGRFDAAMFGVLGAVARLRERPAAARAAEGTLAALEGRKIDIAGAGPQAADPALDDVIAPELLSSSFRALLKKTSEVLDAGAPLDLRALKAAPITPQTSPLAAQIAELASAFGIVQLDIYVSPAVSATCLPVSSKPAQIVIGQALVSSSDEAVRRFLVLRALKAVQAGTSALVRTAPVDLGALVGAYLLAFAPDFAPPGVDPGKLRDFSGRIAKVKPSRVDGEIGALALEVIGSLGNRASTLNVAAGSWGSRVALAVTGDLSVGLAALSQGGSGSPIPASGPERALWIGRNTEARDIAVFSVSDAYGDLRARFGV